VQFVYRTKPLSDGPSLSSADVAKLLQDPNTDNKAAALSKVAGTYSGEGLSEKEREIAESIFRHMLNDAAVRVRKALADSLKDNPDVPHDVAATLARDVDEVSVPMLASSEVLTDDDLMEIVRTKSEAAQKAVAGRESVSAGVADALADSGNEEVIATLVGNEGAEIGEGTFEKVLDKFGDSEAVQGPLANRTALPIAVSERLVTLVSDQLRDHIMTHHEVSASMAADLLIESREKATVSLLEGGESADVQALVDQLHSNGRLTPTLILRALVMGDTTFFEVALAKIVNIPVLNAYQLVHDKGQTGLSRLLQAAKFPPQALSMARAALEVADEMVRTSGDDRDMFKQLMIERVLTAVEDDVDTENLDYLIGKLKPIESNSDAA
jgi:uncharacterized protein (DUF2336 family)